ncbi:hypothetical protein TVAG_129460 [Trichomonas vaginalis G3]|uniref:Uncharacterized protein n=1 Tax=Trichomonas vaginalis (strain ATCC PRA-98 / G3) TaxID=412133 RepID=A2DI42_TRIV3|nr:hairpin DNA cleavage protein SbcCD family [Trichomonas vaginalis G3]EAY19838.1 hypothetical protein TVAG_129460 [Trichomonas vaginalis G3]KAI5510034.1 hairpin DNA cleavage protein SbcCD family [Trichomonas vaginalis G3]|eukprot:XP_001580824.1 hypothetical protein [Trichomonas vaginalis G3]
MSISEDEFMRVQQELIRLKEEKHNLNEQLKSVSNTSQTFLQSLFSGSDASMIERLQKEENELKATLAKLREQISTLNEQCRGVDQAILNVDQVAAIESLFQTKKRELLRMRSLNETALKDLEEEVELAKNLCDSLENGRASFAREKENIFNSIVSLQTSKQTIDTRIKDLQEINAQLKQDLGLKSSVDENYAELAAEIDQWQEKLQNLEKEYKEMTLHFDDREQRLRIIADSKASECDSIKKEQDKQTEDCKSQLKTLKKELSTLKSHGHVEETVTLDIDHIIAENDQLQSRYNELCKRGEELSAIVNKHQTDCAFLANWLRSEGRSHVQPEVSFRQLQQLLEKREAELRNAKH